MIKKEEEEEEEETKQKNAPYLELTTSAHHAQSAPEVMHSEHVLPVQPSTSVTTDKQSGTSEHSFCPCKPLTL